MKRLFDNIHVIFGGIQMKRIKEKIVLVFCFAAVNVFAQIEHVKKLAAVENQTQVGKMSVALPSGEWRILNANEGRTQINSGQSQGGQIERKYLVRVNEKNQLVAAMFLAGTKYSSSVSSWSDAACQRKDTLFIQDLDGNFNFPACLLINHITGFWTNVPTDESDRFIFDWYRANKIELPKTAILLTYRKYFSGDYVVVNYFLNPELLGFSPDAGTTWSNSVWHPALIKDDPKKVKFIESLKIYGRTVAPIHRESLMKGRPSAEKLLPFPDAPL
jgi:hypothetical protein